MENKIETQFERYLEGRMETLIWYRGRFGYDTEKSPTDRAIMRTLSLLEQRGEDVFVSEYIHAYNELNELMRHKSALKEIVGETYEWKDRDR